MCRVGGQLTHRVALSYEGERYQIVVFSYATIKQCKKGALEHRGDIKGITGSTIWRFYSRAQNTGVLEHCSAILVSCLKSWGSVF